MAQEDIRKQAKEEVKNEIRRGLEERRHRINQAKKDRDTTRLWQLIVAGIETGFIEFFRMGAADEKHMKGMQEARTIETDDKPEMKERIRKTPQGWALKELAMAYGTQARRLEHVAA